MTGGFTAQCGIGEYFADFAGESEQRRVMTRRINLFAFLFVLLVGQAHGQNTAETRNTLVGLDGVYIYVEPLAPEVVEKGVTDVVLGAEVERCLRQAEIPVLYPTDDGQQTPGTPTLYLQVTALVGEHVDECVYAIRLELIQQVRLERDEDAPAFPIATWSVGGVGAGARKWRQAIIDDVLAFTDRFVESYVAANTQVGKLPE